VARQRPVVETPKGKGLPLEPGVSVIAKNLNKPRAKIEKQCPPSYVLGQRQSLISVHSSPANPGSPFSFIAALECPLIRGHSTGFAKEISAQ